MKTKISRSRAPKTPSALAAAGHPLVPDVLALATSAGRMVGTRGHREARAYLVERLVGLGLEPTQSRERAFDGGFSLPYGPQSGRWRGPCNVMAVAPGRRRELAPVVLAAHYDTCGPLPGADDNAAAIAIVLEVAAALRREPAERDVILAIFDGEEPPRFLGSEMGSIHWYHHQRARPVHAAIVLDLVGHDVNLPGLPKLADLLFVMGMESHPELVVDVSVEGATPGLHVQPVLNRYVGDLSDHHVFRVNGHPFLFLSCGRWPHYHQATDTPEKLNYTKMLAIVGLTEAWTRRTAGLSLAGGAQLGASLPVELAALRRNFGGLLGPLLGERVINRREHVDAFVNVAMRTFGL